MVSELGSGVCRLPFANDIFDFFVASGFGFFVLGLMF
jgi:hypothetical protein